MRYSGPDLCPDYVIVDRQYFQWIQGVREVGAGPNCQLNFSGALVDKTYGPNRPEVLPMRIRMHWPTGSLRQALQQHAQSVLGFTFARAAGVETAEDLAAAPASVLPLRARLYIVLICLAACCFLVQVFRSWQPGLSVRFILYVAVALASSGMKVRPPGVTGNISVNYVFTLLGLLEFQLAETITLAALGAAVQTFWLSRRNRRLHLLFNVACIVVTVRASAFVFALPLFQDWREGQFLRLTLAGVVYFVVNTLSVSIIIALAERQSVREVWREFYNWLFSYYLVGVSLAEMVHLSMVQLGWTFAAALLPLLYLIFRSYRLYLSKLQQEKSHAESVASLHVRTIEALAMAIEAKDECTHEHLRRVQIYSLSVAQHLKLDEEQMQALQAASILHDIGKLAVPDYIISKPGKLTPEEFEKMKVHTVVGAAILEQVGFPYAVPPIVRSHHERWDGTGYPDGLRGEQIPIGARILTAVDCLDALATDRQYRRALPLDEAIGYVVGLSGKQFDPQVVAVLKEHYLEFEAAARQAPLRETKIDKSLVARGDAPAAGFQTDQAPQPSPAMTHETFIDSIASARQEVQTILEITHDLSASLRLEETLSVVAERLRQLVPFDCIAVYIREGNILRPKYVNGDNSRVFASLAIPVGQGLSGWVVENLKPIINGNPSVEPGYLNDPSKFSLLNAALSVPLGDGAEDLSGALTLYRTERDSYTRDHLRVLLAVTPKISRAIENTLRLEHAQRQANTDELTSLPNARGLCLHLEEEIAKAQAQSRRLAVLVCDLDGFKHVNDCFGHFTGNELLKRAALIMQSNCRESDYVARMGGDEFVLIFAGARQEDLEARIVELDLLIRRACRDLCGDERVGLSVGTACYPDHGSAPETLLAYADSEMYRVKRGRKTLRLVNAS
jgi:diguanylate cyclase (GGDEF)-like protein/putative nucleotidyltransferase with HDIG domain